MLSVLLVLALVLVACGGTSTTEEPPATESNDAGTPTASAPAGAETAQQGAASAASDQATVSDKATYTVTTQEKPAARPGATPQPTAEPTATVSPADGSGEVAFGNNVNDQPVQFTLPSAQGAEYSLAQFKGDKNVVLVFYRAFW
jgi:hypothetical protein